MRSVLAHHSSACEPDETCSSAVRVWNSPAKLLVVLPGPLSCRSRLVCCVSVYFIGRLRLPRLLHSHHWNQAKPVRSVTGIRNLWAISDSQHPVRTVAGEPRVRHPKNCSPDDSFERTAAISVSNCWLFLLAQSSFLVLQSLFNKLYFA